MPPLLLTLYGHHPHPTEFPYVLLDCMLRRRMHSHRDAACSSSSSSPTAALPQSRATSRQPRFFPVVTGGLIVLALYLYFFADSQSIHSWFKRESLLASAMSPPLPNPSICPQVEPLSPVTHANLSSALDTYLLSDEGQKWVIDSLSLAVRVP